MKKWIGFLALIALPVYADSKPSYDYVELGYEQVIIDTVDSANSGFRLKFDEVTGDGIGFEGSFSFWENYFAFADFGVASFNLGSDVASFLEELGPATGSAISIGTQLLGVGYHTNGHKQLVVKAASLRQEIDSNFLKEATFGYDFELGFRFLHSNDFEFEASLSYTDPDFNEGPSGDVSGRARVRYHLLDNLALGLTASNKINARAFSLNLRYKFK